MKTDDKIISARSGFEHLGKAYSFAENITVNKTVIENVDCYWFGNESLVNKPKIVVYLHGGGFVLGSIRSHQALVSHLSKQLSLPILFIEYSLAPEKPYPNAINDILSVYRHLLRQNPKADIIFMGDSAGGGLAVSTISRINEREMKPPAVMVLLSPQVDLSCSNESFITNAKSDPVLTQKFVQEYSNLYIGDSKLAEANPIETMFGQFPPTLILVGSGEVLLDDSRSIYQKLIRQQVNAKLSIYDNQHHVWMLKDIHTAASKRAIKEIYDFIWPD
nr:alpha/beta hydrolase [uncultured Fluviicola sp.]